MRVAAFERTGELAGVVKPALLELAPFELIPRPLQGGIAGRGRLGDSAVLTLNRDK